MATCRYFMLVAAALVLAAPVDSVVSMAGSSRRNAEQTDVTPLQKLVSMLDG
eukprot:CAMPEP_0172706894 /NCGR_PEP_ID=MMETSP1074-20121228/47586_1 /TAXON_ID=2916 /ORGANISM="Ceratium fusus, Strain PA161109" /LENGTH=51 /DNA_ID=CAMNT_0013529573 /DNA_START=69 /DNA_END=220 /DNA_ORIENTATION=+